MKSNPMSNSNLNVEDRIAKWSSIMAFMWPADTRGEAEAVIESTIIEFCKQYHKEHYE